MTDCSGNIFAEGGAPFEACILLPDAYAINYFDSFGDGWNGAIININGNPFVEGQDTPGLLTMAMGSEKSLT